MWGTVVELCGREVRENVVEGCDRKLMTVVRQRD